VKINGDLAVLKAIEKILSENELKNPGTVFDQSFIEKNTVGYDSIRENFDNYSLEELVDASGVPLDQLREAAEIMMHKKRIIICWAMGITQHKNGVDIIKEIINLALLERKYWENRGADFAPSGSQ
jgi:anaerobic selenocysteine-containing dehydrogenase